MPSAGSVPPAGPGSRRDGGQDYGGDGLLGDGAGPEDDLAAGFAQQGLFLSVPAGSFDADRFAQGGPAAEMAPDPLLATIVDTVTAPGGSGVAALSDDQLIGVIAAARRLESRVAWYQLAAVAEFTARAGREPASGEFAADELACELHLTALSAGAQMDYARRVTGRLPACVAALFAGRLHPVHLRIIDEETQILSEQDAAAADAVLAATAGTVTFGKLRAAAHRLVCQLDPDAAARRKEAARRDAHVRGFREQSGNAGMVARELPPAEVLASMQHIEQRARDLRAAGLPGTLQALRVRAYLDLLQERGTRHTLPAGHPGAAADSSGSGSTGEAGGGAGAKARSSGGTGGSPGGSGGGSGHSSGPGPGGGRGGGAGAEAGPGLAALVTITIPWSVWAGPDGAPAEVDGFGLADPGEARDLAAAAARDSRTRWCATVLHPDGTAAAHGCAPGPHPPPRPSQRPGPDPAAGPDPPTRPGPPISPGPPGGPDPRDWLRRARIVLTPITRGHCDHTHAETGYRPSRTLRHLIRARNARCTAPGCGRAAARCDLDHTRAYDQGGITCECDLAPLCRHHHRCKQAHGWQLEQPEPGVLIWRTPAGRTYTTGPTRYAG